jgi:hypothetical protein
MGQHTLKIVEHNLNMVSLLIHFKYREDILETDN